jgi:cysteine-rich repeat protein
MSPREPLSPARVLVHPAWIAALALLVLNDHVLKGAGALPGVVTGKLSDVAGLFAAPALLCVLVRARTRHAAALAHAAVGFGYAALELSSELTAAAALAYRWLGLTWRSWSDPTDLLALAVLPAAFAFFVRAARAGAEPAPTGAALRRLAERGALAAGLAASVASTDGEPSIVEPCASPSCYENPKPIAGENACDDGVDNDGDLAVDCEDADCAAVCADLQVACTRTPELLTDMLVLEGTTLGRSSLTESSCGGADAPEDLFVVTVTDPGTLVVTVPEDHLVSVRSACNDRTSELACYDPMVMTGDVLEVEILYGDQYTIVVEALSPFLAADFTLEVSFVRDGCGDGVRDEAEECDDGNDLDGDGCDGLCRAEDAVLCAALVDLAPGVPAVASLDGAPAAFAGTCAGSFDRPERGFRFTPAASGTLTLDLTAAADLSLFVTGVCGDAASELGCANLGAGGAPETLSVPVTADQPVFVFVELAEDDPADTAFTLEATLQ